MNNIKNSAIIFSLGLLFGIGLIISGMLDNKNVLGFLNIFGDWKPQLALVMGFAVLLAFVFFQIKGAPKAGKIDAKLIYGAAIFGIGWGIVGICPGPSVVLLGANPLKILPFIISVIAGNYAVKYFPYIATKFSSFTSSASIVPDSISK